MKQKYLAAMFLVLSMSMIAIIPITNAVFARKNSPVNYDSFSLDTVIGIRNLIIWKYFNKSLNEPQVVAGKDGFLFLGDLYTHVLEKLQGKYQLSPDKISAWVTKLKKNQDWFEQRGIKFLFVIAPNKHTVYADKLPDNINYLEGATTTDKIFAAMRKKNINFLALKHAMRTQKRDVPLYFKTDTHWNFRGSTIAFNKTIDYFNEKYAKNYQRPRYYFSDASRRAGDLTNFLKFRDLLPSDYEKNFKINFSTQYQVCHGNISKGHALQTCTIKPNPRMGINKIDQYMINESALNTDKLLWLCDSFAGFNSKLFNATFNTIWKFHHSHINGRALANFVKRHNPDVVIYQIVERDIFNSELVTKIP